VTYAEGPKRDRLPSSRLEQTADPTGPELDVSGTEHCGRWPIVPPTSAMAEYQSVVNLEWSHLTIYVCESDSYVTDNAGRRIWFTRMASRRHANSGRASQTLLHRPQRQPLH
jgi:hypothetical protein